MNNDRAYALVGIGIIILMIGIVLLGTSTTVKVPVIIDNAREYRTYYETYTVYPYTMWGIIVALIGAITALIGGCLYETPKPEQKVK